MPLYLQSLAVKLEKNGARKWSKGYAFIQYTCQEDAMQALENMDYKVLLCHLSCYSPQRFTYNNIYLFFFFAEFWWQGDLCRAGKAWGQCLWRTPKNLWTSKGAAFAGARWGARLLVLTNLFWINQEYRKKKKKNRSSFSVLSWAPVGELQAALVIFSFLVIKWSINSIYTICFVYVCFFLSK